MISGVNICHWQRECGVPHFTALTTVFVPDVGAAPLLAVRSGAERRRAPRSPHPKLSLPAAGCDGDDRGPLDLPSVPFFLPSIREPRARVPLSPGSLDGRGERQAFWHAYGQGRREARLDAFLGLLQRTELR